jgi:hypothetical protein
MPSLCSGRLSWTCVSLLYIHNTQLDQLHCFAYGFILFYIKALHEHLIVTISLSFSPTEQLARDNCLQTTSQQYLVDWRKKEFPKRRDSLTYYGESLGLSFSMHVLGSLLKQHSTRKQRGAFYSVIQHHTFFFLLSSFSILEYLSTSIRPHHLLPQYLSPNILRF